MARLLVIVEAGTGFGFIALTISYLPVLYQHFSRRDYQLIEFSARAGSPPTAAALLSWHAATGSLEQMNQWLRDWEIWASDLIESHSAYPMLAFYRSQHDGHSWLAALAVVLDTCTLIIAGADDGGPPQAAATFSAARRVLNVVSDSLEVGPPDRSPGREWNTGDMGRLGLITKSLLPDWHQDAVTTDCLALLRRAYEPALSGLSAYLLLPLPKWIDTSAALPRASKELVIAVLVEPGRSKD